ncbi:ImmA/IrrE family metallo-endopeptidase [Pectinatus frisingensis]|uniref:ImmA/IrrE family metallo-endopeptidase n=1 Tax=Pectinatus frisingensis TaxID=865 RepID=UPI003D804E44
MMMMTSNFSPRYIKMQNLANDALLTLPAKLPIKIKPLLKTLAETRNIVIHTYQQDAKAEGIILTDDNIQKYFYSKDGELSYFPDDDLYYLLYNANSQKERKQWTISHELGHYFAGHHLMLDVDGKIPKALDITFEKEANCFAREFLAPSWLIFYIATHFYTSDAIGLYTIMRSMFKLSKEASFYISKDMSKNYNIYIDKKCYKRYIKLMSKFNSLLNDTYFSIIKDDNNFYALTRSYQKEYDAISYYYYNRITLPYFLKFYSVADIIKDMEIDVNN